MLEQGIYDGDLPCITRTNINNQRCHVFAWGNSKNFENSMKVDNVEVFSKGECYTSHLVSGKKHEKYVKSGFSNICVGNSRHRYELDIVRNLTAVKLQTCIYHFALFSRISAARR